VEGFERESVEVSRFKRSPVFVVGSEVRTEEYGMGGFVNI